MDAATGAIKWTSTGRDADHASVLLTPAHVLYLTSTGELVATSATYAMPLFVSGDLIVRDATGVSRLGGS